MGHRQIEPDRGLACENNLMTVTCLFKDFFDIG
jgi:hypothetical protein